MPDANPILSERDLSVVNIGVEMFAESLARQSVAVVHVQWNPPEKRDEDLLDLLDSLI